MKKHPPSADVPVRGRGPVSNRVPAHPRSAGRGFSLIELLVVLVLLAMLIAILLPTLSAARDRAREIACATNLRSLGVAEVQYTIDHKDRVTARASELVATHVIAYNGEPTYLGQLLAEGFIAGSYAQLLYCTDQTLEGVRIASAQDQLLEAFFPDYSFGLVTYTQRTTRNTQVADWPRLDQESGFGVLVPRSPFITCLRITPLATPIRKM